MHNSEGEISMSMAIARGGRTATPPLRLTCIHIIICYCLKQVIEVGQIMNEYSPSPEQLVAARHLLCEHTLSLDHIALAKKIGWRAGEN